MSKIEESDVGISCFISQLPGFRGILKQRYADFIVNEVDPDGNVVHLTCLDPPPQDVEETATETGVKLLEQASKTYESEIVSFRALAGDSDAECLQSFISQVNSGNDGGISPVVLSPDSDKTHRTAVHNFFKKNFKFLVTDTIDGPDASSKCIRVRLNEGGHNSGGRNSKKRKERGDKPFDSRGSSSWPEHLGKFLRFHLYKENKDTQEALGLIGKMLGIQPRSFGFAGTKDKRSISTQRVTVFKQHASRLASLNDRLFGIRVGDFCYVNEELLLGRLLGNRFTITLRGVVADSIDTVKASAECLGRHGFINYFGLQRFGNGSVPTHLIGAALLRGEWETAVSMILDPKEGERDQVRSAREYYKESGDIDGTLRQLPRHLVAERAILQCMKKCPGNYLQALKAIPRTLRMMYVHSYQSYLWNHAASTRVQKYGAQQVVVGDLVYPKEENTEKPLEDVAYEYENGNGDDICELAQSDETPVADFSEGSKGGVKVVTSEDIAAGNYVIDDVILPLPGCRIMYPVNDIVKVYHDLAEKDAINLTGSVHNVKEFSITSMTGNYRRVFQKPMDFEWGFLRYTDSNVPLATTDLDKLSISETLNLNKKGEPANENKDKSLSNGIKQATGQPERIDEEIHLVDGNENKAQLALKLTFTLPASCYATMVIRELLKTSTSVAFHKTLNQ